MRHTESELKHLEDLCAKATPGPWAAEKYHCNEINRIMGSSDRYVLDACEYYVEIKEADAALICAAREAVPKLIARVRELYEECDKLSISEEKAKVRNAKLADLLRTAVLVEDCPICGVTHYPNCLSR